MQNIISYAALLAVSIGVPQVESSSHVTPLLSTDRTSSGQILVLPSGPISVVVTQVTLEPGARLPSHMHPQPRYGYVLSGSLMISNHATGKVQTFGTGDFIVEAIGQYHSAQNDDNVPTVLLVIDQVTAGQNNVIFQEPR